MSIKQIFQAVKKGKQLATTATPDELREKIDFYEEWVSLFRQNMTWPYGDAAAEQLAQTQIDLFACKVALDVIEKAACTIESNKA